MVNEKEIKYSFFATVNNLVNDTLISLFIPDFSVYLKHNIYPDCAIKVFEHEKSEESSLNFYKLYQEEPKVKESSYQKQFDYTQPAIKKKFIGKPRLVKKSVEEERFFLQMGGMPVLIQEKERYYKALQNEKYDFFFAIDESGYIDDMIHGNDPFNFGAIYLYAKIKDCNVSDVIAGFWQFS